MGLGNGERYLMEPYQELEERFGEWVGSDNVVACSSGTSALHLALECLRLPPGSKVVVPEFTMIACARAVTMAGLTPVFVDCGDDLLLDVSRFEKLVNWDIKAVMSVHIYGRSCDMQSICRIAGAYGIFVIEDCAEYHGGYRNPEWGADISCWSFYRNKIVAGEEGGAISFTDRRMAKWARILRNQGFTDAHDFLHMPRGINARLSNANARPILESLSRVAENLAKRKQVEAWYDDRIPKEWRRPAREVCWVYDLRIPNRNVDPLVHALRKQGIEARHGFKPLSMQLEYSGSSPAYEGLNAYRLSREVFYLPVDPGMDEEAVDRIVAAVRSTAEELGIE